METVYHIKFVSKMVDYSNDELEAIIRIGVRNHSKSNCVNMSIEKITTNEPYESNSFFKYHFSKLKRLIGKTKCEIR